MVRKDPRNLLLKACVLLLVTSGGVNASTPPEGVTSKSYETAYSVEKKMRSLAQVQQRTGLALNLMVRSAIFQLRARGYASEADKLSNEWFGSYQLVFWYGRDLGDHKPLIEWLAGTYNMLEFILGSRVMEITHLVDLKIFNHAIPVVFACVDDVDVDEYQRHFQPFVGALTYWTAYGGCVGATWGGGLVWLCGIAGEGSAWVMKTFVAPRLNKSVWELSCQ